MGVNCEEVGLGISLRFTKTTYSLKSKITVEIKEWQSLNLSFISKASSDSFLEKSNLLILCLCLLRKAFTFTVQQKHFVNTALRSFKQETFQVASFINVCAIDVIKHIFWY